MHKVYTSIPGGGAVNTLCSSLFSTASHTLASVTAIELLPLLLLLPSALLERLTLLAAAAVALALLLPEPPLMIPKGVTLWAKPAPRALTTERSSASCKHDGARNH
jgi:hypothetical protein